MPDRALTYVFIAGLFLLEAIRFPHRKRNKRDRRAGRIVEGRIDATETVLMTLSIVGLWLTPLFHGFADWLDFANYSRPFWVGLLGLPPLAVAIWLLLRAHADLGMNWSPTLEISREHTLVTGGIYGVIRHPIYAALWLSVFAQALMIDNWVAGLAGIATFLPMYLTRVPREERLMIDHFGDEYREYADRVGGVLPRRG